MRAQRSAKTSCVVHEGGGASVPRAVRVCFPYSCANTRLTDRSPCPRVTRRGMFCFINYEIVAGSKLTQKHTWKGNIFYDVWILLPVIVTDVFIINLVKAGVHMRGEPKKILLWDFVKYSTFCGLWITALAQIWKAIWNGASVWGPHRGQEWGPGDPILVCVSLLKFEWGCSANASLLFEISPLNFANRIDFWKHFQLPSRLFLIQLILFISFYRSFSSRMCE